LGAVLVCILLPQQQPAHAFSWDELWQTPDQQAQTALDNGEVARAATLFQNPEWKGAAAYKNKDYATAAQHYAAQNSIDAKYNYGNAQAKAGKFKEAMEAYKQVLAADPKHADAQNNLKVIEEALKKEEKGKNQDKSKSDPQQKPEQDPQQDQQGKDPQQQQGQQGQQGKDAQKSAEEQQQQDAAQKAAEEQAKQQAEQQDKQDKGDKDAQAGQEDPQQREQEQATEQWLRRIPDDPSGLWRRKFQYQYQQRGAQTRGEEW
jgi:Ca-activated chloride channel family protein